MNVGVTLKRAGLGLLAVLSLLQIEASIPHFWHVVIVCLSVFLGYLLGAVNSPEQGNQVKI